MSVINQRNNALSVLDSNLGQISKLYKECFLAMERGALLVYAIDVIGGNLPNRDDYRKKAQILDVFDAQVSHDQLEVMIDEYDHKNEGIMTLITSYSNATYFVTVKLKR